MGMKRGKKQHRRDARQVCRDRPRIFQPRGDTARLPKGGWVRIPRQRLGRRCVYQPPNDLHRDYAVRTARARVHVLCEKPIPTLAIRLRRMGPL
jgi:hypothetical protein